MGFSQVVTSTPTISFLDKSTTFFGKKTPMIVGATPKKSLVISKNNHRKLPIEIDGLPIQNGDFPWLR